jgi:hypothetical protein
MDMNFPHPKRERMQTQRSGDYAVLVAAAIARQMEGATTHFAPCENNRLFHVNDPICARMNYFSSASSAGGKVASGSFLPFATFETTKVNKIGAEIYPDASANCKPYQLVADSPEQPVALRGMEN